MVEGRFRSRTKRRVAKRVTTGTKIVYKDRAHKAHVCASSGCSRELNGVVNKRSINKTSKTVSRPFGGNLCPACMKAEMIKRAHEGVEE